MSALARSIVLLSLLSIAGCTSGSGERCYLDSDCAGSMICCKASTSSTVDGFCMQETDAGQCNPIVISDAGMDVDAGTDAGPDAGTDAGIDAGP